MRSKNVTGAQQARPRSVLAMAAASALVLVSLAQSPAAAADNDDFDAATVIAPSALPYLALTNLSTATRAGDDPSACSTGGANVWFSYTPPKDQRLVASVANTEAHSHVTAYTGARGALSPLGPLCDSHGEIIDVVAGQTIYFAVEDVGFGGGAETFSLQVAPPPVDITSVPNSTGTVNRRTGKATVSGTVTCNVPVHLEIGGELRQKQGLTIARGHISSAVACTPGTVGRWTATVDGGTRAYTGGSATMSVSAFGCDGFTCDESSSTVAVRLNAK